MSNIVAIVGRPNVGKSTLFNRLTQSRLAIVDEVSGVTRDRNYGKVSWNGVEFSIIDTGGYVIGSDNIFEEEIRKQVELAIEEAEIIIFMVDVTTGITAMDEDIAEKLRRSKILSSTGKKVFLTVNKVDNTARMNDAYIFYSLGFGDFFCISSINSSGTGDLLDAIVNSLNKTDKSISSVDDLPKFAIIGRPNVGKSSLLNTLTGEERSIVTPVPHTTRDSIYVRYKKFGYDFFLVDTAGLRKKNKVHDNIEFYSVMRTIRAIENSDVCFLLVDAQNDFEAQDLNIFRIVQQNKKGIVILENKWDLIEKTPNIHLKYEESIRKKLEPFTDVPIIFTSVIKKQRLYKVLQMGMKVYQNRKQRISTSILNKIILPYIEDFPPPAYKGKLLKIKYITQLPTATPQFAFFCNLPQYIREPYKRFLENRIRENFDFTGVPIEINFRKK